MSKILDFYADWCEPCKRMDPLVDEVFGEVQKINIDTEEGLLLAKEYRVRSVPTLIMVTDNGAALSMRVGAQTLTQLNKWKGQYENETGVLH